MARALSVKVPTADIIALLENKIAEIKTAIADYPRAKAQHKDCLLYTSPSPRDRG